MKLCWILKYYWMNSFKHILFVILGALAWACTSSGEQNTQQVEMQPYFHGKEIYEKKCIACHQADGKGMRSLYPPLAQSDFLENRKEDAIRAIKFGLEGEIKVNGKSFNQRMPANEELVTEDIANLMTYISNSWGNKYGETTKEEVVKALQKKPTK